jgi:signal transduction histidine kinase
MVASARSTVQSLDEIVWAVDPENDTLDGLVAYINQYTNQFFESTNIICRLEMPVELSTISLLAEARHDLFLIVKEALNNILRHAGATEVRVQITEAPARLVLVIEDNGCGFAPDANVVGRKGHGLENMFRRAADIGGGISIASARGQGARLTITVPLPSKVPPRSRP